MDSQSRPESPGSGEQPSAPEVDAFLQQVQEQAGTAASEAWQESKGPSLGEPHPESAPTRPDSITFRTRIDPSVLDAEAGGLKELGGYRLLSKVGHGGMGVVYRAKDPHTGEIVALKVIASHRLAEEDQQRRFVLEAETAAELKHPHIVSVSKTGQARGFHFMVMDYVESITLSRLLDGQPLDADTAAKVGLSLAETLEFVHKKGVLHRDLKPSNVLIDTAGQPWLTDFGVAKRLLGEDSETATGMLIGTPSYMPPEQIAGRHKAMGPTSDIYALGAVLYEMLTGRPPFRSDNPFDTLQLALYTDPTPPRRHNRKVPAALESICLKSLSKSPQHRYASASEMAQDLRAFLERKPVTAQRESLSWRKSSWNAQAALPSNLRDPEVMSQWAKVWKWNGVLLLLMFSGGFYLEKNPVSWIYAELALWGGGGLLMLATVWFHRFHHAKALTPLEWQVARLWLLFAFGAFGLLLFGYQMDWSYQQLIPLLLLLVAMAFGCMALFIDRGFALMTLLCMVFAVLVMTLSDIPSPLFGAGFALGLYLPARKYA